MVVLEISVTADEKSLVVEDCHFVTAPVFPFKVKAFVPPEQIAPAPVMFLYFNPTITFFLSKNLKSSLSPLITSKPLNDSYLDIAIIYFLLSFISTSSYLKYFIQKTCGHRDLNSRPLTSQSLKPLEVLLTPPLIGHSLPECPNLCEDCLGTARSGQGEPASFFRLSIVAQLHSHQHAKADLQRKSA